MRDVDTYNYEDNHSLKSWKRYGLIVTNELSFTHQFEKLKYSTTSKKELLQKYRDYMSILNVYFPDYQCQGFILLFHIFYYN